MQLPFRREQCFAFGGFNSFFFFFLLWTHIERNKEHKFCRYCVWTLEMLLHDTQILLKVNQRLCPFKKKNKKSRPHFLVTKTRWIRPRSGFFLHQNNILSEPQFLWPQSCVKEKQRPPYPLHPPLRLPTPDQLKSTPWPPAPRGENRAVLNSWPHAAVFFQPYCELCPRPLTPLNRPHALRWR